MERQQAKTKARIANGQPIVPQHNSAKSKKAGSPSYSEVVKREKHKEHKSDFAPGSEYVTVDPPPELEYRNVSVPGRPSLLSLVTGAVTQSRVANRFSLLLNGLLVLACIDLQFAPIFFDQQKDLAFVRVGGVGDTWAQIAARIPPLSQPVESNSTQFEVIEGAKLLYRLTQPVGAWQTGPTLMTTNETDWTASTQLVDLYPSTQYEYRLVLPQALTTVHHPYFKSSQRFTTWPDPRLTAIRNGAGTHFKFAATSCMIPFWPYNPFRMGKNRLRMKGVEHLANDIKSRSIEFLLFLGDAIYVDVPHYTGEKLNTYLRKYRQIYASPSWRSVYEQIPTMHM